MTILVISTAMTKIVLSEDLIRAS